MLDPIYQDMTCPKCRKREVYLDRGIGFYCMLCGQQFSAEQILLLIKIFQKGQHAVRELPEGNSGFSQELSMDDSRLERHKDQTAAICAVPEQRQAPADREVVRQESR